jgi:hypothetical protein
LSDFFPSRKSIAGHTRRVPSVPPKLTAVVGVDERVKAKCADRDDFFKNAIMIQKK